MSRSIALALSLSLALTGCASILSGNTQKINVRSSTGSAISGTIDGQSFTAPGVVTVTRENKDKMLVTQTEGCQKETALAKSVNPVFFVNILSGGVFGSTTDYSTGDMWKYSDDVVVSCTK